MASSPISNPTPTPEDAGHVPITEEFDSFKHTLPSAGPVIIALLLVAAAVAAAVYFLRATPVASGSIDEAYAVSVPRQNTVLATVQLTVKNISKKSIVLKNVNLTVNTNQGEFSDDFGNVSDFERYFQAFPELRAHSIEGLARETRLPPGQQISGSVIVSFPVSKEAFDARRGLVATVAFYDHPPIHIKR